MIVYFEDQINALITVIVSDISVGLAIFQDDESYFVQAESALSLAKSTSREAFALLLKALRMRSFNEVIAANALAGFCPSWIWRIEGRNRFTCSDRTFKTWLASQG